MLAKPPIMTSNKFLKATYYFVQLIVRHRLTNIVTPPPPITPLPMEGFSFVIVKIVYILVQREGFFTD